MSNPIKTVFVKSHFAPIFEDVDEQVETGEVKKTLLSGSVPITKIVTTRKQTGQSDCEIDSQRLSEDIEKYSNQLANEGYDIISILPVISGSWRHNTNLSGSAGWGYGYGYSYTDGVTIVGRK